MTRRTGLLGRWLLILGALGALVFPACDVVEGGASDDLEQVGRQDRGRDMGDYFTNRQYDEETETYSWEYLYVYHEVILSPNGRFLLAMVGVPGPDAGWLSPGRVLVVQPLPSGKPMVIPGIHDADRINFSPNGDVAWILDEEEQEVRRLDLPTLEVGPAPPLGARYGVLDVTPDGRYLMLSNLPLTDWEEANYDGEGGCWLGAVNCCKLAVLETDTGAVKTMSFSKRLRDIDYHRPSRGLLVTWGSYDWAADMNETTVAFVDPVTGTVEDQILFPNCADELKLVPDSDLAVLSPTHCLKKSVQVSQDPISVIDLANRQFVKTLPGFGPVAISPDGSRAVGFTRREVMEEEWGYDEQDEPVGLIVVDMDSLAWRVLDYGDHMPVFTISPDGEWLFLHEEGNGGGNDAADNGWSWGGNKFHDLARIDLHDLSRTVLQESGLGLERYTWSPDGERLYGLCNGALFKIDVASGTLGQPLWTEATLMSLRPQGDALILAPSDAPTYSVLDAKDFSPISSLDLTL
ncbi:MAG: hypothetical protein ABIK09_16625 [Pseudomonadota bacterium]